MKKLLYPILVIMLLTAVFAETVTMYAGDSYYDEGKNVTILKFEDKKALVCVNNQKGIVAKDKRTDINGVIIEMERFYTDSAKFDIVIPNCYKCACENDCLNLLCQPSKIEQTTQPQTQLKQPVIEPQKTEVIEPEGVSTASIITVILIIIIVLLGIYSLWKKVA